MTKWSTADGHIVVRKNGASDSTEDTNHTYTWFIQLFNKIHMCRTSSRFYFTPPMPQALRSITGFTNLGTVRFDTNAGDLGSE